VVELTKSTPHGTNQTESPEQQLKFLYFASSACLGIALLIVMCALVYTSWAGDLVLQRVTEPGRLVLTTLFVVHWYLWAAGLPIVLVPWLALGHKCSRVLAVTINCVLLAAMSAVLWALHTGFADTLVIYW
jgi:hypothetical protein